jgi:DNA-directed RNA polymerase specialized sigma24 family protein
MAAPKTLAEVLEALPEEERIILTLSYLRGMSAGQIATLLQVPEKSVVAVIASGKARLTAELGL